MGFLKDKEVGKRLENLRGEKSSRQIAIQAGIDPSQYNKIEKGDLSITENILNKLIAEYGWKEDFILFGHGTNVPRGTSGENNNPNGHTVTELLILLKNEQEALKREQEHLGRAQVTIQTLAEIIRPPGYESAKNG